MFKNIRNLWQYCRDEPNAAITDSEFFKFKERMKGKIPAAGNTKNFEIAVPLKHISTFCTTLEMHLINCEINLILTWSNCVITSSRGEGTFTNRYKALSPRSDSVISR